MVSIRSARPAESNEIQRLHQDSIRAFGPSAYDDEQVEAWASKEEPSYPIDDEDHYFIVAENRGELAGFGDLILPDAEITAVYVHPAHAGAGIGSAILTELERQARDHDIDRLGLFASKNAVEFYTAAGYDRIETRAHETSGVELDCIWLEKEPE